MFCCASGSVHNDDSLIVFFHRKKEVGMVNKSKKWWSGLGCWLVQVKIKAADWPVYTASYIPTWSSPAAHCHCPVAKSMDRCRGRLGGVDAAVAVAELLVVRPRLNGGAVCDMWPSGERPTRTKIIKLIKNINCVIQIYFTGKNVNFSYLFINSKNSR